MGKGLDMTDEVEVKFHRRPHPPVYAGDKSQSRTMMRSLDPFHGQFDGVFHIEWQNKKSIRATYTPIGIPAHALPVIECKSVDEFIAQGFDTVDICSFQLLDQFASNRIEPVFADFSIRIGS